MSDRMLNINEVMDRTGLSRTTIYRMQKRGDFPGARKTGARKMAWVESEVVAWMKALPVSEAAAQEGA